MNLAWLGARLLLQNSKKLIFAQLCHFSYLNFCMNCKTIYFLFTLRCNVFRFFWNRYALQELLDRPEVNKFATPIMHGFISINSCFVKGRTFDVILISRRSTLRAGTRYNVRGLDNFGDAANFVETEQILLYGRHISSLVQTRGSIPLLWSQKANLK